MVILNRDDYYSKMETILNDTSKFKLLEQDPIQITFKRENKDRRFLSKLKADNVISDELYKLAPTGSRCGILYGLPKVHKPSVPLCPVSFINSDSFPLTEFLVPLLCPISTNQYTTHDTFSFVKELLQLKFDNEIVMASFDVTSLFTNIPLDETIEIIA